MRARVMKIGVGLVLLAALAGGGAAWATAGGEGEEPVTGTGAEQARAAALAHVGSGRVTGVEREAEGRTVWEVEVRRPDGTTVEVALDDGYRVLADEQDSEEPDDGPDDDPGSGDADD